MNKKVGIVVVTYNRLTLLQEEIEALRNQTYKDYQIIVVNNSSTDGTLEWLQKQEDIITITQGNVGGAGGFYTGMRYAVENGYEYCWVMDDDVICDPNALKELYDGYHKKENIGFVCSKVLGIDGNAMNTPVVDHRGTNGYACYYDMIEYQMIKVIHSTFVSVFISTGIIKAVGLPYKEFFIWGDDTEYTKRISLNYDSYICCKSIVVHKRAIQKALSFDNETNPNRLRNFYYKFRNEAFIVRKFDNKSIYFSALENIIRSFARHLLRGKLTQFVIVCKSMLSLITFKPTVDKV